MKEERFEVKLEAQDIRMDLEERFIIPIWVNLGLYWKYYQGTIVPSLPQAIKLLIIIVMNLLSMKP